MPNHTSMPTCSMAAIRFSVSYVSALQACVMQAAKSNRISHSAQVMSCMTESTDA